MSTAGAYAAVAFVLLQLGEILFPAFDLEPEALRILLALLLAGFPVVVAASWVWDVTRDGIRRTVPAAGRSGPLAVGPTRPPLALSSLVVGSALVLGWGGWWLVSESPALPGDVPRAASIAVLPFTDMSAGRDQAYLGDGVAEEILNILAGVEGLQVAARTSSFAFRDSAQDARQIGERLGVATLLEGSVRRTADRVRVTAQLIDTRTGFHLWSDNFDASVEDQIALQDSIAGAIVRELLGRLDPTRTASARRRVPAEAQDLYWQGRAQWSRRDATGIPGAISHFQEAISIAPDYAEAYAGLADAHALLPLFLPAVSMAESLERAELWAHKAIELDSTLAQPWASLGLVRALRRDRLGALAAFRRALEQNPSYAPALHWRANVQAEMGRLDAAAVDLEKAARLDPLSAPLASDHGSVLLWKGEVEAAGRELERALALDFAYPPALWWSAVAAVQEGRGVAVQMTLTQWAVVTGATSLMGAQVPEAMLAFRETGEVRPEAVTAVGQAAPHLDSGTAAALYALVGARDALFSALHEAVEDGSWANQFLAVNPVYAPYREDPRFREVMAELGAPGTP